NLIRNHYVEEPNPSRTMEGAFKGLVDSLDVLSSYLDQEAAIRYRQQSQHRLYEPGLILYKSYGSFPQVLAVVANSPAEQQGFKVGDLIGAIDHQSTLTMSMLEANLKLKSNQATRVNLKVIRRNETLEVKVGRKLLYEKPFSYSLQKDTSGLLKIHHFYSPCLTLLQQEIVPRLAHQKKPLIVDLRNCWEGEIEKAQQFINIFIQDEKIGYLEKKDNTRQILSCSRPAELAELPLIIWTNQATLGPAEMVAAVLQAKKRAKILGLSTLGMVAEQSYFDLNDSSALVLVSGVFHLPSGYRLWKQGLKPDIELKREEQGFEAYLHKTLSYLQRM
ncbi:MAG: S41 family peptidase, partial [Candidatus Aminicenantales bacterium]